MSYYDPDDPGWVDDEDENEHEVVTVIGLLKDEGTVVQFKTAEGPVLSVPHGLAQTLLTVLNVDGEVPVNVEAWSVF
jgi:hypothetical protein